jgi:hypothetical protein
MGYEAGRFLQLWGAERMTDKKTPSKSLMAQIGQVHKMSKTRLLAFVLAVYKEGFIDGLREGESEFDDALILQEEEAAEYFGQEAVDRALKERHEG